MVSCKPAQAARFTCTICSAGRLSLSTSPMHGASRTFRAPTPPWLRHYVISRWDAPLDSGVRARALLDCGNRVALRYGCPSDSMVLVRPDDHIAAITPIHTDAAEEAYRSSLRTPSPQLVPA